MDPLRLYSTLTRKKTQFLPENRENVKMYVCGPTVYDFAHIGNARPVIVFDLLYRLLIQIYGKKHVSYVRNFTDVDDKINARAKKEGIEIKALTDNTINDYLCDMDSIGALRPNFMPRATEYIPDMVAMIEKLVKSNNAYSDGSGHVLFAVDSFPNYGALSKRSLEEMLAGARVEVAKNKRNPMDFVLWKPSERTLPGWDSPWGRGRPGWHIECSAMSQKILGKSFDIHGGGIDLAFPHHENELAQSSCANPTNEFAKYWVHNGMLTVEGSKMSKSAGNFVTVRDLLNNGSDGQAIRLALISGHYRQPLDWTERRLDEFSDILKKWRDYTFGKEEASNPSQDFMEALYDDLNTPKAISILHGLVKKGMPEKLLASLRFMGFFNDLTPQKGKVISSEVEQIIDQIIQKRNEAKKRKDFELADTLRDHLSSCGVLVKDLVEGSSWELLENFDENNLKAI